MTYRGLVGVKDYQEELLRLIKGSEFRVLLETMVVDSYGAMEGILEACIAASARGVEVTIVYDRYSAFSAVTERGIGGVRRLKAALNRLKSNGIKLRKVGKISMNPFAGRNHIKAVIVDDDVFIGGGVNLTGGSFDMHDYMLRFHDTRLADTLFERLPVIAEERSPDSEVEIDDESKLIVDGGTRNSSLILKQAKAMVGRATSIYYVSKLPPGQGLQDLMKGRTKLWFNGIRIASGFDKLAVLMGYPWLRFKSEYGGRKPIHSKFIVTKTKDGQLEALAGSHNFSPLGVLFGTQEAAIYTKNEHICKDLLRFIDTLTE